jgi:hypothetical protein
LPAKNKGHAKKKNEKKKYAKKINKKNIAKSLKEGKPAKKTRKKKSVKKRNKKINTNKAKKNKQVKDKEKDIWKKAEKDNLFTPDNRGEIAYKLTDGIISGPDTIKEIADKVDNRNSPSVQASENADKISRENSLLSRFFPPSLIMIIFVMFTLASIILFLFMGHAYPATQEDISENRIIWFNNSGNYDRALFIQFDIYTAFTLGVLMLGFYVNSTFVRFGMKNWNIIALSVLLMYFYGLGKLGEIIYNNELFQMFNDLVLPMALIVLAFGSYRIYEEIRKVKPNDN